MDANAICPECGRTMNESYRFCPWCGVSRGRAALTAASERPGPFERTLRNGMDFRISDMQARLGELEKDLNRILSC